VNKVVMTLVELRLFPRSLILLLAVSVLVGCGGSGSSSGGDSSQFQSQAELGKSLFFDKDLSFDRTQSCATCHNPDNGFVDTRSNASTLGNLPAAGSLGDNQISIGDRNAPTAAYAAFSPSFHNGKRARAASQKTSGILDYEGFLGGQFWDGREDDLKGQAGGPPLNPVEMNMPSKAAVVNRLQENSEYVTAFESLFGVEIFNDIEAAYSAMSESIAAFETINKTDFYPFDSKYDRSLYEPSSNEYYEYPVTSKASQGKARFFSSDLTCAACHQLREVGNKGEIFTSFEYHNIGMPVNTKLREANGVTELDDGLLKNPAVNSETEKGKFKVPTLRNVAVTAPYMHNGIFNELETVMHFYQHAKEKAQNIKSGTTINAVNNPETGLPWGDAEVNENIEHDLLGRNQINLNDDEVEAMVCFLMSLTDARYEHLLDAEKVTSCGL
jgi:cytochrome c peroxidase